MSGPPPAAILLGGQAIALAAARSLGPAGVPVHALGDAAWDTVGRSRWCSSFADLGSGDGVQERWLDWLERSGPPGAVVIPCSDEGLELVARNRAALGLLGYRPAEANDDVVLAMLDKHRTYALARAHGVAVPATRVLRGPADVDAAEAEIGFPCALKPLHSHASARHFSARKKVWLVRERNDLERTLAEMEALGLEMLATEIVPGPDDAHSSYYGYLLDGGVSLLTVTKRKLRQFPTRFGLGTYHAMSWEPETAELGLAFFRAIGLRGLACVEFKRDARDGRLKLIEVNHRLTLATELLRVAGVHPARLVYDRALGRPVDPLDGWREGTRLWLPVEDARAFREYRREGELSLGGWIGSLLRPQHFPVLRLSDPAPAIASWAGMARRRLRR